MAARIVLFPTCKMVVPSVTRRARVFEPEARVGSDSEFGRMWLQRVGRCADLSFASGISVAGRGLVVRSDGKKGREVGSYECGVDRISRR